MNLHITYQDYIIHQHPLPNDYEGRVVTTVIESKKNNPLFKKAVLYIHGFSDYFFQFHLLDDFAAIETNFYAIDLRKCGRSLLKHQHPHYCKSLREYFEDIDFAFQFIAKLEQNERVYVMGHHLGGLLALYYTKFGLYRNRVEGLILNSPLLTANLSTFQRVYFNMVLKGRIEENPFLTFKVNESIYGRTLHKDYKGNWLFNTAYKPIAGFAMYYNVLVAIIHAQQAIFEAPIHKEVPILVLSSSKHSSGTSLNAESMVTDVVLNVGKMKRASNKIGGRVNYVKIDNAVHDVFLSTEEVRSKVFDAVTLFLR